MEEMEDMKGNISVDSLRMWKDNNTPLGIIREGIDAGNII